MRDTKAKTVIKSGIAAFFAVISSVSFGAAGDLNMFEAGDIGSWTTYSLSCAPKTDCSTAGPCTHIQASIVAKTQGAQSGLVRLQESSGLDCLGGNCDSNRYIKLDSLPITNWSNNYTRLLLDAKNGGVVPVNIYLQVLEGTTTVTIDSNVLAVGGAFTTVSIKIQDLIEGGLPLTNVSRVLVSFDQPAECATVYVDNLRLLVSTPPGMPTNVSALAGTGSGQLRLNWNLSATVNHYEVYWDTIPIISVRLAAYSNLAVPVSIPFDITGLTNGTPYYIRVVAVDGSGDRSAASPNEMATPVCMGSTAVTAWKGPDRIQVGWNPIAGATQYQLYKSGSIFTCGTKGVPVATVFSPTTTYDDFNVTMGSTYWYIVQGSDGGSCVGACSNVSSTLFDGTGCIPPSAIASLTLSMTNTGVFINWSRPPSPLGIPPLDHYRISRTGPVPSSMGPIPDSGAFTSFSATDTGIPSEGFYCYQVSAYNASESCSSVSPLQCIATLVPPQGSTIYACVDRVRITYSPPPANLSGNTYRIYRVDGGGGTSCATYKVSPLATITSYSSTWMYFDDFGLTAGNIYSYRLTTLNGADESDCSPELSVKFTGTPGFCPCMGVNPFSLNAITAMPGSYSTNLAVAWTKPVAIDPLISRYQVRRSNLSATGPWTIAGTVYEPDPAFFIDTLPGSLPLTSTIFYEIGAVSVCGTSSYSASASHAPPRLSPFTVTPMSYTVTGGNMVLAWAAAIPVELPVSNYVITRTCVATGENRLPRTTVYPPNSLNFWDTPPAQVQWNKQYCWEIAAVDETGSSAYSSGCYNCTPPSWGCSPAFNVPPPGNQDLVALSSTMILVSWNRASDGDTMVSKYYVYRSTVSGCSLSTIVATVWSDGCDYQACVGACNTRFSVTDTGLSGSSAYTYQLLAISRTGCTEMSICSNFISTLNCQPVWGVTCPTLFNSVPLSSTMILVSWDRAVDSDTVVSKYFLFRNNAVACTAFTVAEAAATIWSDGVAYNVCANQRFSYTDTGDPLLPLAPGASYTYKVMAISTAGCSTMSETCLNAGTKGCQPKWGLTCPTLFSSVALSSTMIQVSWDRALDSDTPVSRYFLFRNNAVACTSFSVGEASATIWSDGINYTVCGGQRFTFTDTGYPLPTLDPGTAYTYKVMAISQTECATMSETCINASTKGCQPAWGLTCPTLLNYIPLSSTMLLVSWNRAIDSDTFVTKYLVFRSNAVACASFIAGEAVATIWSDSVANPACGAAVNQRFSFTDTGYPVITGLDPSAVYTYKVMAISQTGCATMSETCLNASTKGCQPRWGNTCQELLNYTALSSSMIQVSWNRAVDSDTPISRYLLFRNYAVACSVFSEVEASGTVWSDGVAYTSCAGQRFSYTDTGYPEAGLKSGTTYTYKVMAISQTGCATITETCLNAKTKDCRPSWGGPCPDAFGAPPSMNYDIVTLSSTMILVSWNRAVDSDAVVSKYFLFRCNGVSCPCAPDNRPVATVWSDSVSFPTCGTTANTRFSVTDTGLAAASGYCYKVMAISKTGCSVIADSMVSGNTYGSCEFSRGPVLTPMPSSAHLTWDVQVSGTISGYEVWRSESSTGKTTAGKINLIPKDRSTFYGIPPYFIDAGLKPTTQYCYVLVLKVDPSCSVISEEVCTSTLKLTVYPNPVRLSAGQKVLFAGLEVGSIVEVYTINGELIKKHTATSDRLWEWDGHNDSGTTIAGGVYLYLIREGSKITKRGKLVINR